MAEQQEGGLLSNLPQLVPKAVFCEDVRELVKGACHLQRLFLYRAACAAACKNGR